MNCKVILGYKRNAHGLSVPVHCGLEALNHVTSYVMSMTNPAYTIGHSTEQSCDIYYCDEHYHSFTEDQSRIRKEAK